MKFSVLAEGDGVGDGMGDVVSVEERDVRSRGAEIECAVEVREDIAVAPRDAVSKDILAEVGVAGGDGRSQFSSP